MSHWNCRICKETTPWGDEILGGEVVTYTIREVYYNNAGEIWSTTVNPASAAADISEIDCETEQECVDSLTDQMEKMKLACTLPVVDLDTIVYATMEGVSTD